MGHTYRYSRIDFARRYLDQLRQLDRFDEGSAEQRRPSRISVEANWRMIELRGQWLVDRATHEHDAAAASLCAEYALALDPIFQYLPSTVWMDWSERLICAALGNEGGRANLDRRELRLVLSYVMKHSGRLREAQDVSLENLKCDRELRDASPADYVESLYEVMELYDALGESAGIEPLCHEVIAFQANKAGCEGIDYADSLFALACFYFNTNRIPQSQELFEAAERTYASALTSDAAWSSHAARNLGYLHQLLGRTEDAALVYGKVTEAYRVEGRIADDAYYDVLKKMSFLYQVMDQPGKALPFLREFLDAWQRAHKDLDATYAGALNDLASVLSELGNTAEALKCYLDALSLYESVVGRHRPEFADCLTNLASLYEQIDDVHKAETAHRTVVEIKRECLGPDHPAVADSLVNLAFLVASTDRHSEARRLFEEALEIRRNKLPSQHPDIAESIYALASLLEKQYCKEEAIQLYEQAAGIFAVALGEESSEFSDCKERLAALKAAS